MGSGQGKPFRVHIGALCRWSHSCRGYCSCSGGPSTRSSLCTSVGSVLQWMQKVWSRKQPFCSMRLNTEDTPTDQVHTTGDSLNLILGVEECHSSRSWSTWSTTYPGFACSFTLIQGTRKWTIFYMNTQFSQTIIEQHWILKLFN